MTLGFGRVVAPADAARAEPVSSSAATTRHRARIVDKPLVDAQLEAARVLERAQTEAQSIVERVRAELGTERAAVLAEARAEGVAELAARVLAFERREAEADQRALDRVVELARVLAERLLGEALSADPARIAALAQQALKEARGARRIRLLAHPDDARELEAAVSAGKLEHVTEVLADPTRAAGHLRLESELGTLDAELGPQLDRLARRLREALSP